MMVFYHHLETESFTNTPDKTRGQPDVVPAINDLIGQRECDQTRCAGEQDFHKPIITEISLSFLSKFLTRL